MLPFKISAKFSSDRIRDLSSMPFYVHDGEIKGTNIFESHPSAEHLGTATLLLTDMASEIVSQIVVEGAPGQGKSTLVQYICQVHRIRLLKKEVDLQRLPDSHRNAPIRIPFKVDLRDLSSWLAGTDPYSRPDQPDRVTESKTLETF